MLVVVTAGGVREKIDNVRSITNSSTGKLGHLIVDKFLESEVDCEIIYVYGGDAQSYADDRVENIWVKDVRPEEKLKELDDHELLTGERLECDFLGGYFKKKKNLYTIVFSENPNK